jgi:hypothetical protein
MLLCLKSSAPPTNHLRKRPDIAALIGLYFMSKNLSALPEAGGVLDMRADHYAYFSVFATAEAEHIDSLNRG